MPPPGDPNDKWREGEPPKKRPYSFGEVFDEKDKTKDIFLCPECGVKSKGKPDLDTKWGEMRLECQNGHRWVFDSKTKTVEDLNKRLEFPRQ